MRSHISLKSNTYTEGYNVYVAGISVKADAHYPGRSPDLPRAITVERRGDEFGEVSRSHSRQAITVEGRNLNLRNEDLIVEKKQVIEKRVTKLESHRGSIGRNPGVIL